MTGPTIDSIFNRVNKKGNGKISEGEVKSMVKAAGVGGGLFGGIEVDQATQTVMNQCDTNKDGVIVEDELQAKLLHLFSSGSGIPPLGEITAAALGWFDANDTDHDGKLDHDQLKAPIQAELEKEGKDLPDVKADIAAKIIMYLIDEDKTHYIEREELKSLAEDIDARLHPVAVGECFPGNG